MLRWGFDGVTAELRRSYGGVTVEIRVFSLFAPNLCCRSGSGQRVEGHPLLVLFEEKLAPNVKALPSLGRRLNDPRIGRDAPDVGERRVAVVVAGFGEIDLADEDHVRRLEHGRIL